MKALFFFFLFRLKFRRSRCQKPKGPIKLHQKCESLGVFCLTGSVIIEHKQKHDKNHDGALLTLLDWFYQLLALAASGLG